MNHAGVTVSIANAAALSDKLSKAYKVKPDLEAYLNEKKINLDPIINSPLLDKLSERKLKDGEKIKEDGHNFYKLDGEVHFQIGKSITNFKKTRTVINIHNGRLLHISKALKHTENKTPLGSFRIRWTNHEIERNVKLLGNFKSKFMTNIIHSFSFHPFNAKKRTFWDRLNGNHTAIVHKFYPMGDIHNYVWFNHRQITPAQRWSLLIDIAQGVKDLHQKGFIHRDIKPSNILIKKDKENRLRAKLADLDTVCKSSFDFYARGLLRGTDGFIDPKRRMKSFIPFMNTNRTNDIYSLGNTLYLLYYGYKESDVDRIRLNNSIPFDELIEKMTDPQQSNRPTIDQVIAQLTELKNKSEGAS